MRPPVLLATLSYRGTLTHAPINAEIGVPLTLLKDDFFTLYLVNSQQEDKSPKVYEAGLKLI